MKDVKITITIGDGEDVLTANTKVSFDVGLPQKQTLTYHITKAINKWKEEWLTFVINKNTKQ